MVRPGARELGVSVTAPETNVAIAIAIAIGIEIAH
jgi:hypothetical protein